MDRPINSEDIKRALTKKRGRIKGDQISSFLLKLQVLLKSGIDMRRALELIIATEEDPLLKESLEEVLKNISSGDLLSQAMRKCQGRFDPILISAVEAGEEVGRLDQILGHLADLYKMGERAKKKTDQALIYPVFLLFTSIAVVIFIINFVMPSFMELFQGLESLPLLTRALINISFFFKNWAFFIAIILLLLILTFITLRNRRKDFRLKTDALVYKLPLIGKIKRLEENSNTSSLLAILWASGVDSLKALDILEGSTNNFYLKEELKNLKEDVTKGKDLTSAFNDIPLYDDLFIAMMTIGEETGKLRSCMEEAAFFYRESLISETESFTRKLEPIMILIMAGLVAFIVIAIADPMFDAINYVDI